MVLKKPNNENARTLVLKVRALLFCPVLFEDCFDLCVYDLAKCIKTFLWGCDMVVLGELET
jgi:hypothetical protein